MIIRGGMIEVSKLEMAKYLALQAADKLRGTVSDNQLKIVITWLGIARGSVEAELEDRKGEKELPAVRTRKGKIVKINREATKPSRVRK